MQLDFPEFDNQFPELHRFIRQLVDYYNAGTITSWIDLERLVKTYFSSQKMDEMESLVPHWQKMSSYAHGLTLVHVMCVFMGLYRMPEFLASTSRQQQLMKWVILLHDVEKELLHGKRDHGHAFRSATGAARILPRLGFAVTPQYESLIDRWEVVTRSALTLRTDTGEVIQDNRQLPEILDGIHRMFGYGSPAASILKTILLHLAVDMDFWPPPSPLSNEEVKQYFDLELTHLLLLMSLGDNDGWNTFSPHLWKPARIETLEVFKKIENMISQGA